jgi:methylmalonyl-CoA mutase
MKYEIKKHDGSLPLVGVNTFLPDSGENEEFTIELARSTEEEKQSQIQRVADFQSKHTENAEAALANVRRAVVDGENGFEALMEAVRYCSLGQLTDAFFEVGGQYRRST